MSTLNHDTELEEILDSIYGGFSVLEVSLSRPEAEKALHTYLYKQTLELIPKDWPIDPNNNSPLNTFNKARNSAYAEMRRAAAERWGQPESGTIASQ